MGDMVYDFTDIHRIDLFDYAELLGIAMPRCVMVARERQPEGKVNLFLDGEHSSHFDEGQRIILLPKYMAMGFTPSADYSLFVAEIAYLGAFRHNKIEADPFYSFMFKKVGGVYIVKADDITDKLINFCGRKDGYLSILGSTGTMQ
jgi:hypothetical protein